MKLVLLFLLFLSMPIYAMNHDYFIYLINLQHSLPAQVEIYKKTVATKNQSQKKQDHKIAAKQVES